MRILYICTVDFSLTGIPVHIRNYYNILSKNNHIDIVAPHFFKNILKTMELRNGTKLYALPRKSNPIKYLIYLHKIVKSKEYDVIHIHGNSSTMALELFACKNANSLLIVHTHNVEYKSEILNRILRKYMLKNADLRFAASKIAGDKLYGDNKYFVIKNGIEKSNFRFNEKERIKIREQLSLSKDKILLGNIGRFCEQKNQNFLIEVAKGLDPEKYHFLLIGNNDNGFFKYIKQNDVANFFTVLPATSKIGRYYSAFDIFVFPSKWEGLGMVAVEAQYSNLPCLISLKVPKEVQISSNIKFLPLKAKVWSEAIKKTSIIRKNTIYTDKYNIKKCAYDIEKLYIAGIKKYEHKKNFKVGV